MSVSRKRRHAIHLVAQLPDGYDDALDVLLLARELVESFLGGGDPRPEARTVRLVRRVCDRIAPAG